MNEQKLPNAQTVLILGIVSIIGAFCCYGIVGVICGIIGLNLYRKDNALYLANPEMYSNYSNLSTGRILSLIGLILGAIILLGSIVFFSIYGWSGYMEMMQNAKMGR